MRRIYFLLPIMLVLIMIPLAAHAGPIDWAKGWLTEHVMAAVTTAVLGSFGAGAAVIFKKVMLTFKEAGEFLTALGEAFEDQSVDNKDIAKILKEGRDVFNIWIRTPRTT